MYDAPEPEAIRRVATVNDLPVDAITEVRVLDPSSTAERLKGWRGAADHDRDMAFDLDRALRYLIAAEGSDLHLKVPSYPLIRLHGRLEPIPDTERLYPEDTERALAEMLGDHEKLAEFEAENEVDFSYAVEGLGRFRVNAFRQRGSVSIVMRAIPMAIRSVDDLGLPEVVTPARRGGARDHPPHRHDRLRQVDHARGDARPHEPDDGQAHRHDRGPDRVPAPRPQLDHQPARGRLRHRVVQARPAARAAPGPGHDPDRRDARRGDRPDRAERGRDRPPRALDAPHGRRLGVDQPHHRLLPAAPAAAGARDDRRHAEGHRLPAARPDRRRQRPRRRAARSWS